MISWACDRRWSQVQPPGSGSHAGGRGHWKHAFAPRPLKAEKNWCSYKRCWWNFSGFFQRGEMAKWRNSCSIWDCAWGSLLVRWAREQIHKMHIPSHASCWLQFLPEIFRCCMHQLAFLQHNLARTLRKLHQASRFPGFLRSPIGLGMPRSTRPAWVKPRPMETRHWIDLWQPTRKLQWFLADHNATC